MSDETKIPVNSLSLEDFTITPVSGAIGPIEAVAERAGILAPSPLGPLAELAGTWKGTGFNQIWRPFHGSQDRFLELNETTEILQFVEIKGDIPNRGLLQADITLHGLTYLQKINDANVIQNGKPAGIHIEPGIWISVPPTTNPQDPATVARLANIPHGTSLVAQGVATASNGAPVLPPADITPFLINQPSNLIHFPETNLGVPSAFRTPPADIPHLTQAMVNNPNVVLAAGLTGKNITAVTRTSNCSETRTAQTVSPICKASFRATTSNRRTSSSHTKSCITFRRKNFRFLRDWPSSSPSSTVGFPRYQAPLSAIGHSHTTALRSARSAWTSSSGRDLI